MAIGTPTPEQRQALDLAISGFEAGQGKGRMAAFDAFLERFPDSPWNASLLINLGIVQYRNGYFSEATDSWQRAWDLGRNLTDPQVKALVDRALGELLRMHARLGHAGRIEDLLEQSKGRAIGGAASEWIAGAREGLWEMQNDPGLAYLCGPMALRSLALLKHAPDSAVVKALEDYRSGPDGVSLGQVARLARRLGMSLRPEFRASGDDIPVPSVVNWKLHHYAAIVGREGDRYHVMDPTFGDDLWLSADAINAETSGYFLVPESWRANGWRSASAEELKQVHGKGFVQRVKDSATSLWDRIVGGSSCGKGASTPMCGYAFDALVVGLSVRDTPVGYQPPIGPAVRVSLIYNQREASQPAVPTYSNFGPKWTSNWLGYVEDDPTVPFADVKRVIPGGGYYTETHINRRSGAFRPETLDKSVLVRVSSEPVRYEHRFADGGMEVYADSDGSGVGPRRVFLSQVVDALGNAVTLHYDKQMRLVSLTDATGRDTTFSYDRAGQPLLVTAITDPFGRSASIGYDKQGRLNSITDVIGIRSQLGYDDSGFVDALQTPYGTTHFRYTEDGVERSLEATDPLGHTERVEFHQKAAGIADFESVAPKGDIGITNRYLEYRNTFYWDKNAYQLAARDYRKALITHWFHQRRGVASGTVESIKPPLESRIWFNSPGVRGATTGNYDVPSRMGRVLGDGSTQLTLIDYNGQGNPTRYTDPAGRTTLLGYARNGIDLVSLRQSTGRRSAVVVAGFTYDAHHRVLSYTDAAGQTTRFNYNDKGQLLSETDPLGNTTAYRYDKLGYLSDTIDANGKVLEHLSRDRFGRVATRTDARGGVTSYEYDALDRPLKVTYPDGSSETYRWKWLDLEASTDRQGGVTHYQYDANRRLVRLTDPLGGVTRYSYYPGGQLRSRIDANGRTTNWLRDIEGRVTARIGPNQGIARYSYGSGAGRLASVIDQLGQTSYLTYTIDDRIASRRHANALEPTPTVEYTYDQIFPRLQSMQDGSGTTTFSYADAGKPGAMQLLAVAGPGTGNTLTYAYDALGRVVRQTIGSHSEESTYDGLGRVATRQNPLGRFTYTYLGETRLPLRRTLAGSPVQANWAYRLPDQGGTLQRISVGNAFDLRFNNSAPGLVTGVTAAPGGTWSYQYDANGRVTAAAGPDGARYAYRYDPAGNLLDMNATTQNHKYEVDAANRIVSIDGLPVRYDANGNLVEDASHRFHWDADNRLVKIEYKDDPKRLSLFRYDGLGRRIADTEQSAQGTRETRFAWCGERLCQVRDASGKVLRDLYEEGEHDVQSGRHLLYAEDQLGSVRALLASADGKVLGRYNYGPFGEAADSAGQSLYPTIAYAGLWRHAPSGLDMALYRAYQPDLGRWLSRDRIDNLAGGSRYAYVGNDPLNKVDPLGLSKLIPHPSYHPSVAPKPPTGTDVSPATPSIPCPSTGGWVADKFSPLKKWITGLYSQYKVKIDAAYAAFISVVPKESSVGIAAAGAEKVANAKDYVTIGVGGTNAFAYAKQFQALSNCDSAGGGNNSLSCQHAAENAAFVSKLSDSANKNVYSKQ